MSRPFLFLALTASLTFSASLFAHDPGLSSAHLARTGSGLEVRLTFAWSDLSPLVAGVDGNALPASASLAGLGAELTRNAAEFVQVYSDGKLQTSSGPTISTAGASANEAIVSLAWPRLAAGALRLEFPVLAKMPFGHRLAVTVGESADAIALLDARHASWELRAAIPSNAVTALDPLTRPPSNWSSFVLLGGEHILTGFDHLCFLFALLLVSVRLREVLAVVTTFTIAHSLTLAAAATGIFSLSSRLVEPLIAASIVYIGIENLFLRRPPRHRIAVVFGFGLVHGLGFASALAERLPGATGFTVVPALLGFNLGVELGQLAVAGCMVPLIHLIRTRPVLAPRLQPVFSLAIAVAGVVWFCQRV